MKKSKVGVLVAVSIPIFTSQLEKARDAVTLSNLRAAYAMAQTEFLTANGVDSTTTENGQTVTYDANAKTVTVTKVASKGNVDGLAGTDQLPFTATDDSIVGKNGMGGTAQNWDVTFTYTIAENGTNETKVVATAVKSN